MNPSPNPIEIVLVGDPEPTPRLRFTKKGRKYTPDTADAWKHAIGVALLRTGWRRQAEPPTCPFEVRILMYFDRPKYLAKASPEALPKGTKPDIDNLIKAILDELKSMGVYRDDGQVFSLNVQKLWVAAGANPGARITITSHPEPERNVSSTRKRPVRNQQPTLGAGRPG